MRPQRLLLLVLGLGLLPKLALAQVPSPAPPVSTNPSITTSAGGNASTTIVATGVFQLLFAANKARRGCTIQNNGGSTMYVTEGIGVAGSTTSNAAQVPAGQAYYCAAGGIVLDGEVDITGTIGDAFYAAQY